MSSSKKFIYGVFSDEQDVLKASKQIREKGANIYEVYSPFPIHGIDDILGYPLSRLPIAAFLFGMTGTVCALTLLTYALVIDWPMNIGGKPFFAFPDFIPITFELTVLLSALGMVATFFIVSDLKPYGQKIMFDKRTTDDKFVIALDLGKNTAHQEEELRSLLSGVGAEEVDIKEANV